MRVNASKRLCLVTDELAGPDYNGGIGTACTGLVTALAAAGFAVDVLYTRVSEGKVSCRHGSFDTEVERFARRGVRLLSILHDGPWHDFPAKSYAALNHLQSDPYDFVFFNETHGAGFFPLLSRRTGNPRLATTRMGVVTHSSNQWILDLNGEPMGSVDVVRVMEMERRSIEFSDVVLSPSAYLIDKYKGYGWRFPADTQVRRYILPDSLRALRRPEPRRHEIDEIVFFGRLERRKGIELFLGMLDRLKYSLRGRTVTFLGKDTFTNGLSTVERIVAQSSAWPFDIRVMSDYDRETALAYLQGGRRLAVMPSLEDNSPCVIQECLELGIPFIAASGSGGEELVAPDSRADCTFAPNVAALGARIEQILQSGAMSGALSFDPEENERSLVAWLRSYLEAPAHPAESRRGRRKAAPGAVSLTVLVAGPGALDRAGPAAQFAAASAALGGAQRLALLPPAGAALPDPKPGTPAVVDEAGYDAFVEATGRGERDFVCLWDASLELNADWLRRAVEYLSSDSDCAAVAGLCVDPMPALPTRLPQHASAASLAPRLRQPIVGASGTLLLLSQESNNGFVLLRGRDFRALAACRPWDETYARLKPVEEWIDELLGLLARQGAKISLIPDHPALPRAERPFFEVFRRGTARRAALAAMPDNVAGSPLALAHQFGIDRAANDEKRRLTAEYLEGLALQTKVPAEAWASAGGLSNDYLGKVATAAFSTGQIELAKGVLAYLASLKSPRHFKYATSVERFWDGIADQTGLAPLLDAGRWSERNLRRPATLAVEAGEKAIVLPAQTLEEGLGRLEFEIDLTNFARFASSIRTAGPPDSTVRFVVSISARDVPLRASREAVATGGTPVRFEFDLPDELRRPCKVALICEQRGDGTGQEVVDGLWISPCFAQRQA